MSKQDLTEQARYKSQVFGNNVEEIMKSGVSLWVAIDTVLKVYDHPAKNYRGARLVLTENGVEQRGFVGDKNE